MENEQAIGQIKATLCEHKKHLCSHFFVQDIGIFGSYLTGTQSSESDLDILVEFEKGHKDFFNYMRLKSYLEDLLGIRVDLVMRGAVKPQLRNRILDQVIYV